MHNLIFDVPLLFHSSGANTISVIHADMIDSTTAKIYTPAIRKFSIWLSNRYDHLTIFNADIAGFSDARSAFVAKAQIGIVILVAVVSIRDIGHYMCFCMVLVMDASPPKNVLARWSISYKVKYVSHKCLIHNISSKSTYSKHSSSNYRHFELKFLIKILGFSGLIGCLQ